MLRAWPGAARTVGPASRGEAGAESEGGVCRAAGCRAGAPLRSAHHPTTLLCLLLQRLRGTSGCVHALSCNRAQQRLPVLILWHSSLLCMRQTRPTPGGRSGLSKARCAQAEKIAQELADKRAERAVLRLLARAQREVRACMRQRSLLLLSLSRTAQERRLDRAAMPLRPSSLCGKGANHKPVSCAAKQPKHCNDLHEGPSIGGCPSRLHATKRAPHICFPF